MIYFTGFSIGIHIWYQTISFKFRTCRTRGLTSTNRNSGKNPRLSNLCTFCLHLFIFYRSKFGFKTAEISGNDNWRPITRLRIFARFPESRCFCKAIWRICTRPRPPQPPNPNPRYPPQLQRPLWIRLLRLHFWPRPPQHTHFTFHLRQL